MLTAHTAEIDEVDDAIDEILKQIDVNGLSKNSVGILTCYYEFIETGIMSALCKRLPFDVIGMTTMASASGGDYGMYRLSLTVLTSDDVSFRTASTAPLSREECERPLTDAYREARGDLAGDPSFIISFFPFLQDLSSADVLKSFDAVCGGIPIWGSVASDMDMSYENCCVIHNGRDEKKSLVMLLLHGPVNPDFIVTSIPDKNISNRRAIITESDGCLLKKVNDMTLGDYFNSIGLATRTAQDSTTVPLMVDYCDGSKPVALAIYSIDKDGSALCGGEMPQGASFFVGEIDYDGIIETARASVEQVLSGRAANGLLMLPCVTRYLMLAPDKDAEIKLVVDSVGDKIPYSLAYSGGEVCPVRGGDGRLRNRHHNYTFSACVF
jgi:hypothetical protein